MFKIVKKEILNPQVIDGDRRPHIAKKAERTIIILRINENGERIP